MQLLTHEISILKTKMSLLKNVIDAKHSLAVEAGEQSTENMMHDDAPQQIAVEEGRVVQAQYDHLRKILFEAEVVDVPSKRVKKIQLGHRVKYILAGRKGTVEIIGYPLGDNPRHISPHSPLGTALIGHQANNSITFNNKSLEILEVKPLY